MKIIVLYFSGTGNTQFVAEYIRRNLKSELIEITTEAVESFNKKETEKYDLLVFGFPVFACRMPDFLDDYIKDIPAPETKGVFLFCTKGFLAGNALYDAAKKFRKAGFHPLGFAEIIMPGSDGLLILKKGSKIAKKTEEKKYSELKSADKLIKKIASYSGNNNKAVKSMNFKWYAWKDWILILFFTLAKKFIGKRFIADNSCNLCRLCEKICPSGNITVTDSAVLFDDKCYFCMRCIHQCPAEAIQIGRFTKGKFRWKGPEGVFNPLKTIYKKQ